MNQLYALTAASVIATLPCTALANTYEDQVQAQLYALQIVALSQGLEETHTASFDSLANRHYDEFTLVMERGHTYRILGVCDEDCSDLDLDLYDENQNLIDEDDQIDSAPIVEVTPRWSGHFTLRVTMYQCNSDPCYYGITVLGD